MLTAAAASLGCHHPQGLTLDKVLINFGKKEFSTGLTFVVCSKETKECFTHPGLHSVFVSNVKVDLPTKGTTETAEERIIVFQQSLFEYVC